tara:strand:- start:468 stop:617 length:150 start_codon:yes stop_codon:yes gene_type:complete
MEVHHKEIEEAVNALVDHWEGEEAHWGSLNPILLTVLAWILDEWVPGEA